MSTPRRQRVMSASIRIGLYVVLSVLALAFAVAELVLGNTAQTFGCVAISLALLALSRVEHVLHVTRQATQEMLDAIARIPGDGDPS